jgi:hypothetical protein
MAPLESNAVSNFVHTKTPFGRGYDYEIGSLSVKGKGDLVSGALGNKDMVHAAQKHAPDTRILDLDTIQNIINDSEFKSKIRDKTTIPEKGVLGIPIIEFFPDSSDGKVSDISNSEAVDSEVLDSNSLEGLSETSDDDKSTNPAIKDSPIRRHKSEPLPQRGSKRPAIRRRNTR